MTAKEFVQSKMPNARSERHVMGRIKGMQVFCKWQKRK